MEKKDKRLLYELDRDARQSVQQLARKIGLSQETTRYRIDRFLKKGIITGFVTYLNFTQLGYFGYCVYCRFTNITEVKKEEIKNYLKKQETIYWIAEYGGRYDISFSVLAKTPLEFDITLTAILNKYSKYLTDMKFIVKLKPYKYERDYLIDKKTKYPEEAKVATLVVKLTLLEKRVLKHLVVNARITAAEIARKINKPLSSVIYTIKRLVKKNIIGGYTILLQPTVFNFQAFQLNIVTKDITEEQVKHLFSYCKKHPNIIFAIKVLGDWNIELIYEVENAKKMQEQLINLRNTFSTIIKDVELINLFEDYIKLNHYPFKL